MACVMSCIFATAFAHRHPILNKFENNLQQLVTFVNQGIGTISKIPSENFPNDVDQYVDKVNSCSTRFGQTRGMVDI